VVVITKDDNSQITTNFKVSEFYCKSFDAPSSHSLDIDVINAVQFIRTYFNCPIRITSTFRTFAHSLAIGSNPYTSQHRFEKAIDFQFIGSPEIVKAKHELLYNDIINKGFVFQKLEGELNIKGFGLYNTFFHIDTRENEQSSGTTWNSLGTNGTFSIWDKKKNDLTDIYNSDDGIFHNITFNIFFTLLTFPISIYIIRKLYKNFK